jgi:DNA polymerase-3 subunit delta'
MAEETASGPAEPSPEAELPACGRCKSCRQIAADSHPDWIRIRPERSGIRIGQVRELLRIIALRPYAARYRLVLLHDAHRLNPSAGNALLKALEEPPSNTIFILLTDHLSELLPTIVSRCQRIPFHPIAGSLIRRHLMENGGCSREQAASLAAAAGGSLSRAEELLASDWCDDRARLIKELSHLQDRAPEYVLALAEHLSGDRERLAEVYSVMESWLRDSMVWKLAPEKIINKDLTDSIQYGSQEVAVSSLMERFRAVQAAQRYMQHNVNARLTLEELLLRIGDS